MPEGFKDTEEGKKVMEMVADINSHEHEVKVIRGETESAKMINTKLSDKKELQEYLEQHAEKTQDMLKFVTREKKEFPQPSV